MPVALQSYSGTVTVISDKTTGDDTITVSGMGLPVPSKIIGLSGNLAFGYVLTGQTATATLTITNSGNTNLTVSSISYPAGFSGSWSGVIAPSGSQTVTVSFMPVALQSYSGTVTVISDKTTGGDTISVSGVGADAHSIPTLSEWGLIIMSILVVGWVARQKTGCATQ
jgi:hypothetical protein